MPAVNNHYASADRYCITLLTHGQRTLLADGGVRLIPTPTGNATVAAWLALLQALPRLVTEAVYLTSSTIYIIVTVKDGANNAASLRLLHSAVRRFKNETTRRYNSNSTQDYHSRLWQTAFGCEPVLTPAQHAAFERQMAAQGAYQAVDSRVD